MGRLSRNKALQHINSAQQRICYKCVQKYIIKRTIFTTHRQNMSCRITNTWRNTQTHCEVSREETTDRRHKQLRAISGRVGRETRLTKHTRGDQHLLSESWSRITNTRNTTQCRVAELGSLSLGAKMTMKIFVKRVFTIFATNASFLRVIANLQN